MVGHSSTRSAVVQYFSQKQLGQSQPQFFLKTDEGNRTAVQFVPFQYKHPYPLHYVYQFFRKQAPVMYYFNEN